MIRQTIRQRVSNLLNNHGCHVPPIPVGDMAIAEGLLLESTSFPEKGLFGANEAERVEGELAFDTVLKKWKIRYHLDASPVRQRFTIAHELGHYILHKRPIVDRAKVFRRNLFQWDKAELEANVFAAEILMPYQMVHDVASEVVDGAYGKDHFIELMATRFFVSRPAMRYHLINLGLMKERATTAPF